MASNKSHLESNKPRLNKDTENMIMKIFHAIVGKRNKNDKINFKSKN